MTPQEQLCEKMRVEQSAYCFANASGKVSNTDLLTAKQIMEQIWRYIKGGGVQ